MTPSDNVNADPDCDLQSVTTEAALPQLSAPANISVMFFGNQAYFDWDDVTDADQYLWEIATSNAFGGTVVANSSSMTSDTSLMSLTPGSVFYMRIKAQATGFADSNWSSVFSFGGTQLATPALSTSGVSSSGFTINWNTVEYADEADIEISTNSGFTAIVGGGSGSNSGSYTFASGSTGVTYYYRVRQRNHDGWYLASAYAIGSITLP